MLRDPDTRRAALAALLLLIPCLTVTAQTRTLPGTGQVMEPAWQQAMDEAEGAESPWVNRLALSHSAYLRQHADNPINWFEWSEETLALAEAENRLIFLSIGYASCHWCHVMERESFADVGVATVLNESYVAIKVDRELQPDVDAYYLDLVRRVRGESGWPITLILTPDRSPVLAANYLSADQVLTAAERYARQWREQPGLVQASAEMLSQSLPGTQSNPQEQSWDPQWLNEASDALIASIDPQFGGFGVGPKFPGEVKFRFLLNEYKRSGDPALRELIIQQLDQVLMSGMTDTVFGGVFRYTTDRAMRRPHFEKMLYNQALMVSLLVDAADWLGQPGYRVFADQLIGFTNRALRLNNGFAAAVDAEFQQREGGYYLWPPASLSALPAGLETEPFGSDGERFIFGMPESESGAGWLMRLAKTRQGSPRRIENRITAWNALWIKALIDAGLDEDAAALADALWSEAWTDNTLYRLGTQPGYLDDYVHFSGALWNLYLRQGEARWKRRAARLDRVILDRFLQDGKPWLSDQSLSGGFEVDLSVDRELPSPVGELLRIFSYHQSDPDFNNADGTLKRWLYSEIAPAPVRHLAALQELAPPVAARERMIALGHGRARLSAFENGLTLLIQLDPGWHINAAEISSEQLVPTQVSAPGQALDVTYPQSHTLEAAFSDRPIEVFDGEVSIAIEALEPERFQGLITLVLQACSDRICLLPERLELRAPAVSAKN